MDQDALPPTPTCEPHQQQKHLPGLPTAKHHATEGRTSARKMPKVTSETVEKTIVFGGFTATAGCYCHLLPATCAPNAAADNRLPYLLLLLVNRTSNKSTCRACRQQNTMPLKDELTPESPPKAPADSKTPCH